MPRSWFSTLLLLLALLVVGCMPSRGRGNNNGGGGNNDDVSEGDDDDAAGDDDDAAGDDDDAQGVLYFGDVNGGLKAADGGGECSGNAELRVDEDGVVIDGRLTCGEDCVISFSGPYAFSEEPFTPSLDCSVGGVSVDASEVEAWIWGTEGEYAQGNVSAYGSTDYFYVSFDAYPEAG